MDKPTLTIDGANFSTLVEFFDEVNRTLIRPGIYWGRNLDAFNDILRGGFGTPKGGFILVWENSDLSRKRFGYPETARWKAQMLQDCHPLNRERVAAELEEARNEHGSTLFDELVDIIRVHCKGGREEQDGVELVLR